MVGVIDFGELPPALGAGLQEEQAIEPVMGQTVSEYPFHNHRKDSFLWMMDGR
jgi:hypothetical protein